MSGPKDLYIEINDSDPRAVAYVAGRAPNRWGILADGSRALDTTAGAKGQEKGSKTAMVKNLFNGLMKGGVSEENAVDYRQHPLYPCISLMLLQVWFRAHAYTCVLIMDDDDDDDVCVDDVFVYDVCVCLCVCVPVS